MSATPERSLFSADIYTDSTGKKWSAVIRRHPPTGGDGVIVWQRHDMRTQNNAELAMDKQWNALNGETHER